MHLYPKSRALSLEGLSHYHQAAGVHPGSRMISDYSEYVEVITGGRGWVVTQDGWREVIPGDILWHRSGDRTVARSDWDNPYRCLVVHMRVKEKKGRELPRFAYWPDLDSLWSFTAECTRSYLDEDADRSVLLAYAESRLFFQLGLHLKREETQRYPEPLRKVLDRIEHDFARPLAIADLARTAGWSSAYLQEAFKRYTGTTPHQWLLKHRIRMVKERLISSYDPIKQIAVEGGFGDAAALTHAFKAHTGQTPTYFREAYMGRYDQQMGK